jgi:hypothetical protein
MTPALTPALEREACRHQWQGDAPSGISPRWRRARASGNLRAEKMNTEQVAASDLAKSGGYAEEE